ncbi:MAG: DNA repair protein RadA [Deltaproteobacteria bacterium]|nr:MAG: DNA repair protein RadA [Deltaproteobacteria bacterium]
MKTVFRCQTCGFQTPKWMGRCPDCENWNTLVEEFESPPERIGGSGIGIVSGVMPPTKPIAVTGIDGSEADRLETGIGEFDRVIGGGIVPGSVVLLGGDPGIGKSTLMLQVMERVARLGHTTLYVSGEESARQTKLRGDRIGVSCERLLVYTETSLPRIMETIVQSKPGVVVVDSIQTIFTDELGSAPGSIAQVRECSARLQHFAKGTGIPLFLIGHVTKDGSIAGPRVLEHIVDTVLYFEGDPGHAFRILRTVKNRFGSTNEIGVFEMTDHGLEEVTNPSASFLSQRPLGVPGSVVVPSLEGTRPILVEVQALVSPTTFAVPRRTAIGVEGNRVALLTAVLEKKLGLSLSGQDIYLNIAGGVRIDEPAVDLGIAVAIVSSLIDVAIEPTLVVFGEIGLAGEIRGIGQADIRVGEAAKLGFQRCILPANNVERLQRRGKLDITGVAHLSEVMRVLFQSPPTPQGAMTRDS